MNDTTDDRLDREVWIARARSLLDESARDLDAITLSRLNRARQAALARAARGRAPRPWLLPAGLASACCALLLAVAAWQPHGKPAGAATAISAAGEADAIDAETPEFYQNLDFYAWLDAQARDED